MNPESIRVKVHDGPRSSVQAALGLLDEAQSAMPTSDVLNGLCKRVASIAHAEVVSIYVRDAVEDILVMRGNVGFPRTAVGRVRLRLGEGLVGLAAECAAPVSAAVASERREFKPVAGLGEEEFPSFLAVPVIKRGTVLGVLVLQRRARTAFSEDETVLAAALSMSFVVAIEQRSHRSTQAPHLTGSTSVLLRGHGVAPGTAMGRCAALPDLDAATGQNPEAVPKITATEAFAAVANNLRAAFHKLAPELDPATREQTRGFLSILEDQRLRNTIDELCTTHGAVRGLGAVARRYAAHAHGRILEHRAREVEDLCQLVGVNLLGSAFPTAGSIVLLPDDLQACMVLAAHRAGASGFALGSPATNELGVALARAARMPVVAEVHGLFAWTRNQDRVLIDGDRGAVRVNPPATRVQTLRRAAV